MDDLHTDDDLDLLLASLRPFTPAEEAAARERREDFASYLDELGFPEEAAFVRERSSYKFQVSLPVKVVGPNRIV
ncbi:MAG TPA: hypothetical protein VGB53_03740 [Rubricoccaceae bacterium]|jgi:hypothetical protein